MCELHISQKYHVPQPGVAYNCLLVLPAYGGFYEAAWANRPCVMHLHVKER